MKRVGYLLKKQWFIFALLLAVSAGITFPQAASLNPGGRLTSLIVALVFLGIGFTLPSESLIRGLTKWKRHLFIQGYIFFFTPLFFLLTLPIIRPYITVELYIGLLALSVLPTTISTCSVFTQISHGDVALTLFNASFSNIIGVFLSPILLSLLLREVGASIPISVLIDIITGLAFKMIVPLAMGQLLRFRYHQAAVDKKALVGIASNLMILSIVFLTLAKSASTPILKNSAPLMMIPVLYLMVIHFLLIGIAVGIARLLRLPKTEMISIMYAAPQKTLAMGVPLMSAYFADKPVLLGVAILPLLFYHPWELFIAGLLKTRVTSS